MRNHAKGQDAMTPLLVNPERCTRCGRCAAVCPMGIVTPPGPDTLPEVKAEAASRCMRCGHCEAFCPEHALTLRARPGEDDTPPADAGFLPAADLIRHLKSRRSIRRYTNQPVSRDTILELLDAARYAASGTNAQPVQWLVLHDPARVRTAAALTIDWMQTLVNTPHPLGAYVPALLAGWKAGYDVICLQAPHLLVAHIPVDNPVAQVDAILALTHVDLLAPAMGLGTCWAGFLSAAAGHHPPLQAELALPPGRKAAFALLLGHPLFSVCRIPRRKPLAVTWR